MKGGVASRFPAVVEGLAENAGADRLKWGEVGHFQPRLSWS
jgi:hypothetical protein